MGKREKKKSGKTGKRRDQNELGMNNHGKIEAIRVPQPCLNKWLVGVPV